MPESWNDWGSTPTKIKARTLEYLEAHKAKPDAPLPTFVQSSITPASPTRVAPAPKTDNFDLITSTVISTTYTPKYQSEIVERPAPIVERPAPIQVNTSDYITQSVISEPKTFKTNDYVTQSVIAEPKADGFTGSVNSNEGIKSKVTIGNIMLKENMIDNAVNYYNQAIQQIEKDSLQMVCDNEYVQALNGLCEAAA